MVNKKSQTEKPKRGMDIVMLGSSIGLCLIVGFLAIFFSNANLNAWYPTLVKPSFTPPTWLFGIAWIVLYVLLGCSVYLMRRDDPGMGKANTAFLLFGALLLLSFLWNVLFFPLRSPLAGFIVIVLLWLAIGAAYLVFFRLNRWASWLLIPMWLWVTYLGFLCYWLYVLNPSA
jgi:tryptophan-rich sensory protein